MAKTLLAASAGLVMVASAMFSASAHTQKSSVLSLQQIAPQVNINYPNGQTCAVTASGIVLECWKTGTNPP
ncbi:DUF3551 domain-containing protein [Gluconobacter sp. DsW_056]|uniref:DUF3551 domain-containing protein n=1 Tax=Gluconobacter sp. DsW_056 TaxID=1511209 RepID=UPI00117BD9D9|nr:DUF3551 domain-containing protein [Gluconobacter sp. DsW_056]